MIGHYDWAGGREAMLRFGPAAGPVVVAALPLFEEANRTRAFTVTILRALAARGIASALPDLPGTGESLVPTHEATLQQLREAFESAVRHFEWEGRDTYSLALRSGALLDGLAGVDARWHFAPMTGQELLREVTRMRQASAREAGVAFDAGPAGGAPVEVAGNLVSPVLLDQLAHAPAEDGVVRTVRLETDARPADLKIPGSPLWRRAEPDNDPELAELLADDIAAWVRACEG